MSQNKNQQNRRHHNRSNDRRTETATMKLVFYRNHRGSMVVEGGDGSVTRPVVRFSPLEGKEYDCLVTTAEGSKYSHAAPTITADLTADEWLSDAELRKPLDFDLRFTKTDRGNFRAFLATGQIAQAEHGFVPALNETRSYRCVLTRDGSGVIAKALTPTVQAAEAKTTIGETVSKDQQVQMGLVKYRGQLRNAFEVLGVKNPKAPSAVITACHNTLRSRLESDKARNRVPEARKAIENAIRELELVYKAALELNRKLHAEARQAKRDAGKAKAEPGDVAAEPKADGAVMITVKKAPAAEPVVDAAEAESVEVEEPVQTETIETVEVEAAAAETEPTETAQVEAEPQIPVPAYKPVPEDADPQVKKMIQRENAGLKRRYDAAVAAAKQTKSSAKPGDQAKKAEPIKGLAGLAALAGKLPTGN